MTRAFIGFLAVKGLRMQPTSHAAMSGDGCQGRKAAGLGAGRFDVGIAPLEQLLRNDRIPVPQQSSSASR